MTGHEDTLTRVPRLGALRISHVHGKGRGDIRKSNFSFVKCHFAMLSSLYQALQLTVHSSWGIMLMLGVRQIPPRPTAGALWHATGHELKCNVKRCIYACSAKKGAHIGKAFKRRRRSRVAERAHGYYRPLQS